MIASRVRVYCKVGEYLQSEGVSQNKNLRQAKVVPPGKEYRTVREYRKRLSQRKVSPEYQRGRLANTMEFFFSILDLPYLP